jgi:hypothetical protein
LEADGALFTIDVEYLDNELERGANTKITIFGDFCQFSPIFANFWWLIFANFLRFSPIFVKKMALILKTNVTILFPA